MVSTCERLRTVAVQCLYSEDVQDVQRRVRIAIQLLAHACR